MGRIEPPPPGRAGCRTWVWRVLVAALLYVVALAAYYLAVHDPGAAELSSRERALEQLETRLNEATVAAARRDELRQAAEALELEHRKLDRVLPTELPSADDLDWLDSLAESVGIELSKVETGEVRALEFYLEQSTYVHAATADLERLRTFVQRIVPDDAVDRPPTGRLVSPETLLRGIDRDDRLRRMTAIRLEDLGDEGLGVQLTITAYAYRAAARAEARPR